MWRPIFITVLIFSFSPMVYGQIAYLGGTVYTQNFNSLPVVPGIDFVWTDNVTLPGWYETRPGPGAGKIRADNGSSSFGFLYSYGSTGSSDRALGSTGLGLSGNLFWGVRLINIHPTWTLTSFTATFRQEQWRDGVAGQSRTTFFEYKLGATAINDTGFTGVAAGNLVSVSNLNLFAIDGNANAVTKTVTVHGINWGPGQELWLRWRDPHEVFQDHGLAIDDFSLLAVPEPASMLLVGLGMGGLGCLGHRVRRKFLI